MKTTVLDNPRDCTGCAACEATCSKGAIRMVSDEEGFLAPRIDPASCTECGRCEKACPVLQTEPNPLLHPEPQTVLAGWHLDDEIRLKSSSGGVFSALAESIFAKNGVVVGAALTENLEVRHMIIESPDGLHRLRGSKYVQSQVTREVYQEIRRFLKEGRPVFFTGTPCQVAGVRSVLRNTPGELYCCDVVCHGTPSPRMWKNYLEHLDRKGPRVVHPDFRDKTNGWKKSGPAMKYLYDNGTSKSVATADDPYLVAFLRDYCLRWSCYDCKFTRTTRAGDITLADFWGVAKHHPEYDQDDKGTSLILVNSDRGSRLLEWSKNQLQLGPTTLENAIPANPMLKRPSHFRPERRRFYKDLDRGFGFLIVKYGLGKRKLISRIVSKSLRKLDELSYTYLGRNS